MLSMSLSPSSAVDIDQLAHQLLEHGVHAIASPALTSSSFQRTREPCGDLLSVHPTHLGSHLKPFKALL